MKTTRTLRVLLLVMALVMIFPLAVACNKGGNPTASTEDATEAPTQEKPCGPFDPPLIKVDANASVYSGTPDTSWYTGDKKEYTLTSADQLMGFHSLRSETFTYEGITIKLSCDVILNQGTAEEIKAKGAANHAWGQLNSSYLFKGTFDGQGHTISGLYMQLGTSAIRGMFGGVSGKAAIKNFTLENSYFGGPSANKQYLGCLIARVSEGADVTVSDVTVRNTLKKEGSGMLSQIGGLVGVVESGCKLTVENSSFNGTIDFAEGGSKIGGILGAAQGSATVILNGCQVSGVLDGTSGVNGLIGATASDANVTETNCNVTAELK